MNESTTIDKPGLALRTGLFMGALFGLLMVASFVISHLFVVSRVDTILSSRPREIDPDFLWQALTNFVVPATAVYLLIGTLTGLTSFGISKIVARNYIALVWTATWGFVFGALSFVSPTRNDLDLLRGDSLTNDWATSSLLSAPERTIWTLINSEWAYSIWTPAISLDSLIPTFLSIILGTLLGLIGGTTYVLKTRVKTPKFGVPTANTATLSNIAPPITILDKVPAQRQ